MKTISSILAILSLSFTGFGQTQLDTFKCTFSNTPVIIDGQASEECWENSEWHAMDQVWIPFNTQMKPGDFEGRFKLAWDMDYLYVLVEVVDDLLSDDHPDPFQNWWDDDCVEIFIDEDRSMGYHELSCNAFAYHVSLSYDALDMDALGRGVNYKDNLEVKMDTNGANTYLWELAIKMYDASFTPGNPEASRVYLEKDKLMGFAIAYCDNDETTSRENFIGSMVMTAAHNNDMYKNADYFGPILLTAPESTVRTGKDQSNPGVRIYPLPASKQILVESPSASQNFQYLSILNLDGQVLIERTLSESTQTVNIELLSPGIYLLQLHGPKGSYTQRIVKE